MISLLVTIAIVGLLVWLFTVKFPLPSPFDTILWVVAVVGIIFYVLAAFGLVPFDIPVPRLN